MHPNDSHDLTSTTDANAGMAQDSDYRTLEPNETSAYGEWEEGGLPAGRRIGRYRIEERLGQGGLGVVYKAWDLRLLRFVALKFLHTRESSQIERILREAQAQARVENPNICKVYDVGVLEEHPYIAMQFIDGKTLDRAAKLMTTRQKVAVIQKVAETLQDAHRQGLIHRDIKPTNIMVVQSSGRGIHRWQPFLLDFGLAREKSELDREQPRAGVGSPAFMSPEQAKGESGQYDRKTDVYSLGATLYFALTGSPPFQAPNKIALLLKVIDEPHADPRLLHPRLSMDLVHILNRSMEKDPTFRYESAQAFSEDLRHFLDGDPVQARPHSLSYLLIRKLMKHRALSTLGAVALLTILVLLGALTRNHFIHEHKAVFVQHFASEVESVSWFYRVTNMMPAHDVRPHKEELRHKLEQMKANIKNFGHLSLGPGEFAIGYCYLALEQYDLARNAFDKAIQNGYATPESYLGLGEALTAQYERAVWDTARFDNPELKKQRILELRRDYLDPALSALRSSAEANPGRNLYLTGLISYCELNLEATLHNAELSIREAPWLFESWMLAARAQLSLANQAGSEGKIEERQRHLDLAGEKIKNTLALANSHLPAYLLELDRLISQLMLDIRVGRDISVTVEKAREMHRSALLINPDEPLVDVHYAKILARQAEHTFYFLGENPQPLLDRSNTLLERAKRKSPEVPEATYWLAFNASVQGEFESLSGRDASRILEIGAKLWEEAQKSSPYDPQTLTAASAFFWSRADFELSKNLNPNKSVNDTIHYCEMALKIDPNGANAMHNIGLAQVTRAEYEMLHGKNPMPSLEQALLQYRKAIRTARPQFAYTNYAFAANLMARYLIGQGKDPSESLADMREILMKSEQINPNDFVIFQERAHGCMIQAEWLMNKGQDPSSSFNETETLLAKAQSLSAAWNLFADQATLKRLQAEYGWRQKRESQAESAIQAGLKLLEQGFALNPDGADLFGERGMLYLQRARLKGYNASGREWAKKAADALEECFKHRASNKNLYGQSYEEAKERMNQ